MGVSYSTPRRWGGLLTLVNRLNVSRVPEGICGSGSAGVHISTGMGRVSVLPCGEAIVGMFCECSKCTVVGWALDVSWSTLLGGVTCKEFYFTIIVLIL